MNPIEWLLYAAACERWNAIGGFSLTEDYQATRLIVLHGDQHGGWY